MMTKGKLLLLPNLLDETLPVEAFLPASLGSAVSSLQGLIAESEKSGRRYLRKFVSHDQMANTPLALLNEHSQEKEIKHLLEPILQGQTWGLISDAGLPCVADPGSSLVALAQENGIEVQTFAGPCSIIMALQLSGFSGQNFAFHGYLPKETETLRSKVLDLEKKALQGTQIWIEAPYRSMKMLEFLKETLLPETRLCVAAQLTLPGQRVVSLKVSQWRSFSWELQKEPAVFLIYRTQQ